MLFRIYWREADGRRSRPARLPGLTTKSPQLVALFDRLSQVATLPTLAVRIIQAASNLNSGAAELQVLVEKDPVLVARLMRVANSAYYSQSRKVDSIQRAITLLGNRRLANMALTVLVARQFREQPSSTSISRERLWNHSAAVATIADLVADTLKCCDPEQAYMTGLLHDFGLLVIDQSLQNRVPAIVDALDTHDCLSQAVRSVLPFTPGELGSYIARRSNLPEAIVLAIEFHAAPDELDGDDRLADVVHFADYLAKRHGASIFRNRVIVPPSDGTLARLKMSEQVLRELWQPIEQRLTSIQQFGPH